jgi:hypothetical protein
MSTLRLLEEIYSGPAWHGPSVKEALHGVTAGVAAKKLPSGRHSIWELVLHLAHGRHIVVERLNRAPLAEFPRKIREPWWPILDYETTDEAWRTDLQLLDDYQSKLLDAVRRASEKLLAHVPEGSDRSVADQMLGMAVHDGYHAGQIKLLALEFGVS